METTERKKLILEVKYVRRRNDHAASAYTTDLTNICVLTWIVNERVGRWPYVQYVHTYGWARARLLTNVFFISNDGE